MTIGTFCLVKNESAWIMPHVMQVLPFVDEMVFFDGNSTDGTIEILEHIRKEFEGGKKIRLFKNKDPFDLQQDYVDMFNICMRTLNTDLAWFLHPDMFVENPEQIKKLDRDMIAGFTHLTSFGGDPEGQLFKIEGRGEAWKNIYRLTSPNLGAHYFGHYGAVNEDVYFSEITGDLHEHFGTGFTRYPYLVFDTGIRVLHFSDVRSYNRRLRRMIECLKNQGCTEEIANDLAPQHPRVSLKVGNGYDFIPAEYPAEFMRWKKYSMKLPCLTNA